MPPTTLIIIALCLTASALIVMAFTVLRLGKKLLRLEILLESLTRTEQQAAAGIRDEIASSAAATRREQSATLKELSDSLLKHITDMTGLQHNQLAELTKTNEQKLESLRKTVEQQLHKLQQDNSNKLDQMRRTVDEKLHATLEKRLGESFKIVGEQLEQVHRGLGEMQNLAVGVGDLKKVLSNVKARGTWGEVSLGFLLEDLFTPEQYARNVATRQGSSDRVEFALKLPGRDPGDSVVWLPIDAKFPEADYRRLVDAAEAADSEGVEEAAKNLERFIKQEAKKIREKYIDPPRTTDFALLYLPVESLYAEVLRRPGLCEALQREQRVVIAGPTTIAALLNSLQMGFRSLAIEKRSSEVWKLLGAVKTEFGRFGDLLDKTHKKLQEAGNTIETAARKSRTIERRLRDVQELPSDGPAGMLEDSDGEEE
ncbi:MAG: DNA recombination protein RmuC [Deltaproteobacteria bacterium]|nr:DNA recombination protein RmuC [Deltaproteobacteria bacterium]